MVGAPPPLNVQQLCEIMPGCPRARAEGYFKDLTDAMVEFEIHTTDRAAAFLAQLAHESGEFRYMEELASGEAYEGRKDLGNTFPGDGKRYKGRGPIQLTGRANYRAAGKALSLDLEKEPKLAALGKVGFRIAAWFWKSKGLNELADSGQFDRITRIINGGYNGKAHRDAFYTRAKRVLQSTLA